MDFQQQTEQPLCQQERQEQQQQEEDNSNEQQQQLICDQTNIPHGQIGVGYELQTTLTELDLTHNHLTVLNCLPLLPLRNLKRLSLRQNLVKSLLPNTMGTIPEGCGLEQLPHLETLDLYDNSLSCIERVRLSALTSLDLSFNRIHKIENLDCFPSLKDLFLIQNKIRHIKNLFPLADTLLTLELASNGIREMRNLFMLTSLQYLWLGRNKITRISSLEQLTQLKILSLQSNRITKIECLENLVNLEELYLSHNGITRLEGLDNCLSLKIVDVSVNEIPKLENLQHLTNLEDFWCNGNNITSFEDLNALSNTKKLQTVYFEKNPIALHPQYRNLVATAVPSVTQIDATYVVKSSMHALLKQC